MFIGSIIEKKIFLQLFFSEGNKNIFFDCYLTLTIIIDLKSISKQMFIVLLLFKVIINIFFCFIVCSFILFMT